MSSFFLQFKRTTNFDQIREKYASMGRKGKGDDDESMESKPDSSREDTFAHDPTPTEKVRARLRYCALRLRLMHAAVCNSMSLALLEWFDLHPQADALALSKQLLEHLTQMAVGINGNNPDLALKCTKGEWGLTATNCTHPVLCSIRPGGSAARLRRVPVARRTCSACFRCVAIALAAHRTC